MIYYHNEVRDGDIVYSIDKLRVSGTCSVVDAERLCRILSSKCSRYYMSNKPMSYKHNFTFELLQGTIYIGVCLVEFGKIEVSKNVIEFNPNKMGDNDVFEQIKGIWYVHNKNIKVSEWDLAVDYPVDRNGYSLVKDNRNYQLNLSRSKTEYLGRRHENGFVKLYNKSFESDLDYALTRLEITFKGVNLYSEVEHCIPCVRSIGKVDNVELDGLDKWILDRINESDDKEEVLRELKKCSRRKYEKITPYLSGNSKELMVNSICYNAIVTQLGEYENRLFEMEEFSLCQVSPFVDL